MPQVNVRRMKALGVTGAERLASLPNVPTFDEMPGLKGYSSMVSWTGIFAPAARRRPWSRASTRN
jgi:tripartite-type tricarboxylate transporter receptor subunit TctC